MKRILDVPYIDQTEKYPTGCESISSVMLLKYLGYDITPEEFIDSCLEKRDFEFHAGILYGPHPDEAFIGCPYNNEIGSYGCYAGTIAKALEKAAGDRYRAKILRGLSVEALISYIDENMPVVFWATLDMQPHKPGPQWRLLDGSGTFQWRSNQHCLLLVGYDENHYYFNDPWHNKGCVGYEKALVESRYEEMHSQAVVLIRK